MRRIAAALLVLFLMVSFLMPAAHADDASVKLQLQARYDEYGAAVRAKDWIQLHAIYAPDYRSISVDGKSINAEQELTELQQLQSIQDRDFKTSVRTVRLSGELAYVEQQVEGHFSKTDASGKAHAFTMIAMSSDIWRLSDTRWTIVETATHEVKLLMDGREIAHKVQ
jgi:ketosteroid isomerase-like protein